MAINGPQGGNPPQTDPIDTLNSNVTTLVQAINNLVKKINGNSTQTQSNSNIIDSLINNNNQNAQQNNLNARDQARLFHELDQATRDNTESVDRLEIGMSALKTTVSTLIKVGELFLNRWINSADAIRDAYNNNLNQITTLTGETTEMYGETIMKFEEDIRKNNLDNALKLSDYYNQYAELLDQGFTTDQASRSTLSTMIAKKVIPGLNTSNRAYQYLTRAFGSTFQDNLTSIALYSRQQYGKLIESSGVSTSLIEDLYANLEYWSAKNGVDFNEIQNEIYATTAMVTSSMGEEVGSQFEQMLAQLANGDINTSSAQLIRAIEEVANQNGVKADVMDAQSLFTFLSNNQGLLGDVANQWAVNTAQMVDSLHGNAEGIKGLADEGFMNKNALYNIASYIEKYGELDTDKLSKLLEEQKANPDKPIEDLADEMYQTKTEITAASDENSKVSTTLVDTFKNWSDQNIDLVSTIANGIVDIAKVLIGSLLFKKIVGGGTGGLLGGNLLGKAGSAIAGGARTVGSGIANGITNTLGGGSTAIGALRAGGIAIGLYDTITGVTESLEEGKNGFEAVAGGLNKLATGVKDTTSLEEDLSGQLVDVGKNIAKWAMIGGPVGGALGAIATSVIYAKKNWDDYTELTNPKVKTESELLIENLQNLSKNTDIYNTALDNAVRLQGLLNEKDTEKLNNEERAERNRLKKEAEEASKNVIDSINNLDFSKITESPSTYQTASLISRLEEASNQAQGKSAEDLQVQYLDYIDSLAEQGLITSEYTLNNLRSQSADINNTTQLLQKLASIETSFSAKNSIIGQNDLFSMIGDSGKFEITDQLLDKYGIDIDTETIDLMSSLYSGVGDANSLISDTINTLGKLNPEDEMYKFFQKQLNDIVSAYTKDTAGKIMLDQFLSGSGITLSDYGITIEGLPQHAEGLGYVPYDGYVSALHEGEMVLTSELSDKIRNMTGTPQVIVDNSDLSQGINNITTAINSQTAQLLEALVTIYDVIREVGGKEPKSTYTAPTPNFIYN